MKSRFIAIILLGTFLSSPAPVYAGDKFDSGAFASFLTWLKDYFNERSSRSSNSSTSNSSYNSDSTSSSYDGNYEASDPGPHESAEIESAASELADYLSSDTGWEKERVMPYTRKLAETLSQLSPQAQEWVFYGS